MIHFQIILLFTIIKFNKTHFVIIPTQHLPKSGDNIAATELRVNTMSSDVFSNAYRDWHECTSGGFTKISFLLPTSGTIDITTVLLFISNHTYQFLYFLAYSYSILITKEKRKFTEESCKILKNKIDQCWIACLIACDNHFKINLFLCNIIILKNYEI